MTDETDLPGDAPSLTVELTPETADANAEVRLVACLPDDGPDMRGRIVVFRDAAGAEIGRAALALRELGQWRTEPFAMTAPATPGTHPMTAALIVRAEEGESDEQVLAFDLPVGAHTVSVAVWDVPATVERGAPFRIRVGLACTAGCATAGWGFRVVDEAGETLAEGKAGDTPWPGTSGLCHAEASLTAPDRTGALAWTVLATAPCDHEMPHAEGRTALRTNVVEPADVVVRVRAVDAATGTPVPRAKVVAHPFRVLTDAEGRAELRLPKGGYTLFVSGGRYFPFKVVGEVEGNLDITAELQVDRDYTAADMWA